MTLNKELLTTYLVIILQRELFSTTHTTTMMWNGTKCSPPGIVTQSECNPHRLHTRQIGCLNYQKDSSSICMNVVMTALQTPMKNDKSLFLTNIQKYQNFLPFVIWKMTFFAAPSSLYPLEEKTLLSIFLTGNKLWRKMKGRIKGKKLSEGREEETSEWVKAVIAEDSLSKWWSRIHFRPERRWGKTFQNERKTKVIIN